jgi:hypothetical protein
MTLISRILLTYELNKSLARRKRARTSRQQSAELGISRHWRKAGEQCRRLFPQEQG